MRALMARNSQHQVAEREMTNEEAYRENNLLLYANILKFEQVMALVSIDNKQPVSSHLVGVKGLEN